MNCIDMGQADSSLYRQPSEPATVNRAFCWYRAVGLAAKQMGFESFLSVPDNLVAHLHAKARVIRDGLLQTNPFGDAP